MRREPAALLIVALLLLFVGVAGPATADEGDARTEFARGAELVKQARWAEALAAFEKSNAGRAHPVTLFNIGACERALGSYTRARRTLLEARALDEKGTQGTLPVATRDDVTAFLGEIESVLVSVEVRLDPATATVTLDGRPLEETKPGDPPTLTAGLAAPGAGRAPPSGSFLLELDPGAHVLVIARPGFADVVRRVTFAKGEPSRLDLVLARLDGTLEIAAERDRAAVSVDGIDVGIAPVTLRRPAGRYHVAVRKSGFVAFETDAVLEAGGRVGISAPLPPESEPITKSWWFWATAGGVIATATVTTYFLTRPDPERPAANGGGLGWVLRTP